MRGTPQERFWARVNKDGPIPDFAPELGRCWIWTGAIRSDGYGVMQVGTSAKSKLVRTHRFAYELAGGVIPSRYVIDHLCRVTQCCNPNHLEAVPHRTNILRGFGGCADLARQTHCKYGHEFTPENTYRFPSTGYRCCRECMRRRAGERRK